MTDEIQQHRRAYERGIFKAVPITAAISAAALAWTLAASWVTFRDDVFDRCHAAHTRITALESYRIGHDRSDELQQNQIDKLGARLDEFQSSRDTGWHSFDSRLRLLERTRP